MQPVVVASGRNNAAVTAEQQTPVTMAVRLQLAHAAVQWVAARNGIDLLHIKGYALDPTLREGRSSTDVDVLVRPDHVRRAARVFTDAGWRRVIGFETGSAFSHSLTLLHPVWGYLDLHRLNPGISQGSFGRMWERRTRALIGGFPCPVPDLATQRLIVILHVGRSRPSARGRRDLERAWYEATPAEQDEVRARAEELGAQLGFDVAFGRIEDHREDPAYRLWKVESEGGTRLEEWRARVHAAETLVDKVRLVVLMPLVNVEHLENLWGRPPTRRELVREFFARPARGVREEWARMRGRDA